MNKLQKIEDMGTDNFIDVRSIGRGQVMYNL